MTETVPQGGAQASDQGARSILYRARRIHVAEGAPAADAMLVVGDRIATLGHHRALDAQVGGEVERVDYRPYAILPGMIDAHCHIAQLGYLTGAADVGPDVASDIGAMQHVLARTNADRTGWIVGRGFVDYGLRERRGPTRDELDHAVGGVPCVVYHASLHACVVNTAGLRALGIDEDRGDEPGGRHGRDAAGRLDGRLIEGPMFTLFAAAISERLEHSGAQLVGDASRHLASFGITSVVDANTTANELVALAEAARSGDLAVRVGSLCRYSDLAAVMRDDALRGVSGDALRIVGAKVFADGGMTNRTAAVHPAYEDPAGEVGMLLRDVAGIDEAVRMCAERGIGLGVHAQGERAIGAAITAFGASRRASMLRRIEHGGAFSESLQEQAEDLGLSVVSQPAFLSMFGDGFLEAFGSDRAEYLYPFRSLLQRGIRVAFSSDAPVITASPWIGVRDAQLRVTAAGALIGAAQRLTAREALDCYTVSAARTGAPADDAGVLAPGAPADFVVIREPFEQLPAAWGDIEVIDTVVGNRRQFHAGPMRSR